MNVNPCTQYQNSYQTAAKASEPVRILSIDGGGIRGMYPAMLLKQVEQRTHKKASELFDITAGTSAGSSICAGVATGMPAEEIVKLWQPEANNIFSRSWTRFITTGDGLFAPKWPIKNFQDVLQKNLGDVLLKDAKTELICPAFETTTWEPWYFSKSAAINNADYSALKIREVVQASSSAQGYFQSCPLNFQNTEYNFIDGGTFASNPTDVAYSYAGKPEHCLVLSIGTGRRVSRLTYREAAQMGFIAWALPTLNITLQSSGDKTHDDMQRSLPKDKYFRWQTNLGESVSMDDPTAIPYMVKEANQYISANDKEIDRICDIFAAASNR